MIQKNSAIYKAIKSSPDPLAAERDYMECRVLDAMFANDALADKLVFSGGATLTKSYNICPRVSHDLDIVCTNFTDIPTDPSRNQLKKYNKNFTEFLFDQLRSEINYAINQDKRFMIATDREWRALHNPEQHMSYPTLHLLYTSALNNSFEHICLEIVPRKYDASAISAQAVIPYSTRTPMREIPTVAYEQTFWDKIFALHCMAQKGLPRNHFFISRHYFDVAQMADMVNLAATYHLFDDTIMHQRKYTTKVFDPISGPGEICLTPNDDVIQNLQSDYQKNGGQFLTTPPAWNMVMAKITDLKSRLNKLEIAR